ncbi:vesicle-associated protein 1-1-like [Lycium ferocissimum]|uniref:vesicle-associated protein 1-1-like n=1 Tax=Lycium ferocissimum TaxID=112874 RepID=UPI002814B78A|nr:vesicle-associated protein 1-1-like [Lycium ferocissimum]
MSSGDLLNIEPLDLKFRFELKKQISCSIHLSNNTENHVAFKVKTTNPKKYCVRPNTGIVLPRSTSEVTVTMQAQKEAPSDMQCKDKFLLQSVVATPGIVPKDITQEMFNKEEGRVVDECKLKVIYLPPQSPPSPVAEGSEEGSSPKESMKDNGHQNGSEDKSVISRLMAEKASALQQSNRLRQELELVKRDMTRNRSGGVSFILVIMVGLLGIVLGYVLKRS